jgi:hypothetical protein
MELGAAGETVPPDAIENLFSWSERIRQDDDTNFDVARALQKNLRGTMSFRLLKSILLGPR